MVSLLREEQGRYDLDLLNLRNDVVFKAFFGDRRNNKLLLDFLKTILGEQIIAVDVTNPYTELAHANDKSSEMDLRVLTSENEQINIEIQLRGHQAFNERMLIYWAKMYAGQDEVGESYTELKKAIQIVITDFKLLSKRHFHSQFQLIDVDDGTLFSAHAEIHVLELPKIDRVKYQDSTRLEQWLFFLKSNQEVKEALAMESSIMKEAFEEIQRLSQDPRTRQAAISREIMLKDQLQRELDAKSDGVEQSKKEVVINMHSMNLPIDTIVQATNLSREKVIEIIESHIN